MIALADAITLLLSLIDRAAQVSNIIQQAHAAGQTSLTAAQMSTIIQADDSARSALADALAKAAANLKAQPSVG